MGTDVTAILESIGPTTLAPVVSRSLHGRPVEIGDWRVSQLGGGAGNPVSAGLYRFEGYGREPDRETPWAVVLKIIQSPANLGAVGMGEGDDQAHWNYWRREPLVYRSGLLAALPQGLAAPRCYDILELPGDVALLWLEDIRGSTMSTWDLEQYALIARHLGRLNGAYLSERPLPDFPWFSRQLCRQWMAKLSSLVMPWEHPAVLARYPTPEVNAFRCMLADSERFLAALDLLPKTVCHGDTYPTNFVIRPSVVGGDESVALDWALTGVQPVGDDLGQLVFGAHNNLTARQPEEVTACLFQSYLGGLHDGGSRIDPELVRFGFVASAALRVGLFRLIMLSMALNSHAAGAEEPVQEAVAPHSFEVNMALQAFDLLESL